ncbi:histidine kinase [Streptomyces sp. NPDC047108]|uniref:sensor histidine kinase n=1 Tax=Streptomyces sp. NPDC047108 TaxID=3155025 RepID=UPI00340C0AEE
MTSLAVGQGLARPQRWLRAHPLALDAAVAAVVLAIILVGMVTEPHGPHGRQYGERSPEAASVALAVLAAGALVLRRRMPQRVLTVTSVLSLAELVVVRGDDTSPVAITAAVAVYTVASRTDRSTTWRVGLLTAVGLTATAMLFGARPWYVQQNVGIFAWTGMAAAAGDAVRSRRAFVDAIRERAERAERTREEEARRRVAEERMRIARELHDVVAHHIALVNVQAGVAAHVMDNRPDQAKEALAHVREASRSALTELRATVGLLRQFGDPEAPTEPAPGLGLLDQLIDSFARAGLPVEVEVASEVPRAGGQGPWHSRRAEDAAEAIGDLPKGVDLTAYRVVQEALTNTQKHAGERARAVVRIARARQSLEITVLDDGAGEPAQTDLAAAAGPERGVRTEPRAAGALAKATKAANPKGTNAKGTSGKAANGKGVNAKGAGLKSANSKAANGKDTTPDRTRTDLPAPDRGVSDHPAPDRTDSAVGADIRRPDSGGGHGLMGMRERAAVLGGVCETGPRHGGGFRVHVRLPLTDTQAGEAARKGAT